MPGTKLYVPLALIVNVPPLEPGTAPATLPATPFTAATVRTSLSGSVSFVRTLPLAVEFSVVAPPSLLAVGAGFVTVQMKLCDVVAP